VNPSTALARVLIDEFVRNGVTDVVLAPGSRSAPLAFAVHAADAAGRLRLHVRIDERSAAFTALGMAKATGAPAAVVTTSGTAVANLHPAVLEAHHAGVPLLVVTADRPDELRGVGANQTIDQVGIFGGAVRLFHAFAAPVSRPGQVAYWRSTAARACIVAAGTLSGAPGPVHLDVAFRDPLVPEDEEARGEPLDGRAGGRPWAEVNDHVVAGSVPCAPHDLAAEPGTVVVVGAARRPAAAAAWRLAEARGWPVLAEPWWRGGGPAVACAPLVVAAEGWLEANLPDRVLVVGRPTLSRSVARLVGGSWAPVEVVASGTSWSDPGHAARRVHTEQDLRAAADAAAPGAVAPGWSAAWTSAGQRAHRMVDRVLDESVAAATRPSGIAAVRGVLRAMPEDAMLFLGSSSVVRDVDLVGETLPSVVLANRGVSGIDGTVSTAVGSALSYTRAGDTPGYAIMGDLAFLHDANGLVMGPDEPRPDLCIVVVNDGGGGVFALLEQGAPAYAGPFERVFGTPHGVDLDALCAATRTPFERVDLDKLDAALAPQPGLRVVEVAVDRSTHRELHSRLRRAVAEALA
jgi:2-succinyl-5-enolpyruvyl-6-hydroxy-3-cyclohexene-1-carboxylate synthase